MSDRTKTILKAFAALAAIVVIGLTIAATSDKPKPAAQPATTEQNPCPDTKPCIELTAEDGTKYKLNDFRFLPDHCIAALTLPDRTSRKMCGNWHLDWIGPDTSHDIKGQKI
jgi:hypothetical protein